MIYKDEWNFINEDGTLNYDAIVNYHIDRAKEDEAFDPSSIMDDAHQQQKEYFEANRNEILEKRRKLDYAFLFDFGDNDFGSYFGDMIKNQIAPILSNELSFVSDFVTDDDIEETIKRWFDKEYLFDMMKRMFIGEYVKYKRNAIAEDCNKAIELLDYLFKENKLFIGTNAQVDDYIKENYSKFQDKETLDGDNVDLYWFNGEVCVVRIINNNVSVPTSGYIMGW